MFAAQGIAMVMVTFSGAFAMRWIRWIVTLAYAGVIFFLSSRTWGGEPLFPHADKVIHSALYGLLAGLCAWSLSTTRLRERRERLPLAALMALLYGVTDELHQLCVPGRTCDVVDLVFDGLGACLGAWLAMLLMKRVLKRRTSPCPMSLVSEEKGVA